MEAVVSSVSSTAEPKAENTMLLQTVRAWTEGPAGRKIVCSLLDGCSQRSFIHEGVVKALGFPVLGKETLHLYSFGSAGHVTV